MFDVSGLLLTVVFAPIIIINEMKHYNNSSTKSLRILAYILLGFELFRFFYTAQLYERAYMPSDKVTFTFLSFAVVLALFAVFNKSKIGQICKLILPLCALAPVIIALFYPHVYTNELDIYAVAKAMYFAEAGIVLTVGILLTRDNLGKFTHRSLLFGFAFVLIYIFANVMRNVYWTPNMQFNLTWFLCMGAVTLSVALTYTLLLLVKRMRK